MAAHLAGLGTRVVLVLDDFPPEPDSVPADCVVQLMAYAGPALHIVIMCRSDPPLPLRRYSLAGRVTQIRAGDLAFGEPEIAAVLAQHGVRLSASALRALGARTEGWAAGVRLAAMSMEAHPDPEAFVEQFAGDDQAVVGYLLEEVLDAQPPAVRRLLLATSVVDGVNAELAAELAGPGAAVAFAAMTERNSFVEPLGHGWYRYHAMFREALRLVLRHETPGEEAVLNRRAASWFDRAGRLTEAVQQAACAGDWRYAAWLVVDRLAVGRVLGFRVADPLAEVFRDMPGEPAFSGSEPEPAIVAAAVAVSRGDERACAVALQHAERLLGRLPIGQAPAARLCASAVRFARDRSLDSIAAEGPAVEARGRPLRFPERLLGENPGLRSLLTSVQAAAVLRDGRLDEAAGLFEVAVEAATQAGGDFQRRSSLGYLALVEVLLGRVTRAAELTGRAARLPEVSTSPPGRRSAAAHLASAAVELERCEPAAACEELGKAESALLDCPDAFLSVVHRLFAARAEVARGRPARALEVLGVIGREPRRVPWLDRRLRLVAVQAHAARGAVDEARAAAVLAGGAGMPGSAVALARAEMCGGEHGAAADLVRQVLAGPPAVPADVRVEAWLLDACLAYGGQESPRGRRSLDRAFRLADREQIRLPFALAREWLGPVLRHDPELGRPYQRLLGPLGMGVRAPRSPGGPEREKTAAVESLSPRELDVLLRLARMLTTEEIAADLCLSINTVKTHLKSIYRKLGVTRRGEAVRRARTLALLRD
ncbi:LuxR C-terminal-related transcriptional regulator [Actinomadura sp. NTSP31]|uniref:LuxR C-terminal-related transcriptional regulator n=1 Tax=Actinomadura sp. NTSP31 TaxID=1735447 RepID=UPI0035C14794